MAAFVPPPGHVVTIAHQVAAHGRGGVGWRHARGRPGRRAAAVAAPPRRGAHAAVVVASWASAPRPAPLPPGAAGGVAVLLAAAVAVAAAAIGALASRAAAARGGRLAPDAAALAAAVGTAPHPPPPSSRPPPPTAAAAAARSGGGAASCDTAAAVAAAAAPPPPTIGLLRLAFLAVFRTPGFWAAPLRVLPVAAAAAGAPDVLTITVLGRPLLTALLSAPATAAALAAPEATLSVEAVHSTARRALEPPPRRRRRRDAAAVAEEARQEAAVVPVLLRHMRAALTRTWWTATGEMVGRLDRAIGDELATAVAAAAAAAAAATATAGTAAGAPAKGGDADGKDGGGAVVELFETTSKLVLRAGVAAFLGDAFASAHGNEVWTGLRDWQLSAWTLPWVLFPRTARRLRPALTAAHTRAYAPILATVSGVLGGSAPAEAGTYLADAVAAVRSSGLAGTVDPVHVATQIFGVLVAMHINTYATGAWAVAHVATDGRLAAAVTAEVDALAAGLPPPIPADGASPTGLPVLEAVWVEAMRVYQVAPSIRLAKAPYHVAASAAAAAAAAAPAAAGRVAPPPPPPRGGPSRATAASSPRALGTSTPAAPTTGPPPRRLTRGGTCRPWARAAGRGRSPPGSGGCLALRGGPTGASAGGSPRSPSSACG
ncbi:hypothetical protein I4F81_003835 [Pyropia yezoensis]|uniref:Uncharacterized protein n=1 Tax=Pyropia yezoensis TaxID=2788 RepID=A0ACC3BU92_PYRYE|nr:hypothetical protein I4F81_003835 [Neopyropia yezoensis]